MSAPALEQWCKAASLSELRARGRLPVQVDGVQVGLFLIENVIHAIDNLCTHGNACLTDGVLEGYLVECPLHAGLVDLRSGKAAGAPITRDSRTYPVKVEGDQVWVGMLGLRSGSAGSLQDSAAAAAPKDGLPRARRVLILGAGGTIAMVGRSPFDWVEYGESGRVRSIDEVLAEVGPLLPEVVVETRLFRAVPSTGIGWQDWVELGALLRQVMSTRGDLDGIVVTHGTASLEETAWFLDLVCDGPVPIVVVGAQRPPNTCGSDAVPNLRAAVAVATSPRARDLGVLVVMNNTIFAARDVRKTANYALDAFEAPEFGPLGRVEPDGAVTIQRRPVGVPRAKLQPLGQALANKQWPRVDIALSYAGADGTAVDAFCAAGASAIINVGMPPGRCSPAERAALRVAVASGLLVVQSSRAPRDAVVRQKYNDSDGICSGGNLAPNKLRILLMVALAAGMKHEAVAELLGQF